MDKKTPTYSKLHAIEDGVLVCINEKKQLFKYIKLEQVKIGNKTLGEVLEEKDHAIKGLERRLEKLESFKEKQIELNKLNENGDDF
jgi:hypothetical protein